MPTLTSGRTNGNPGYVYVPEPSSFCESHLLTNPCLPWLAVEKCPHIGTYPYKAVFLHQKFSLLQLNAVALRGHHSSSSTRAMSARRTRHANVAIDSAMATLKMVLDDPYLQKALVGVPLYLHSMITFAAVFLLKIAAKQCSSVVPGNGGGGGGRRINSIASAKLDIDFPYVQSLVGQTIDIMVSCSERASRSHLSHHIARGLRKMLSGLEGLEKSKQPLPPSQPQPQLQPFAYTYGAFPVYATMPQLNPPPRPPPPSTSTSTSPSPSFPLSAEQRGPLIDGSDPTTADWWGFDEDYFPMGVYDFLQSQMPG